MFNNNSNNNNNNLLVTPWSRVLLQKQTRSQLGKKFPTVYGTRMSITAFTSPRHLSLSWASSIQSITPHPTSWRSTLLLFFLLRLGLPIDLSPLCFFTNTLYTPLPPTRYVFRPSHSLFYHPNSIRWGVQVIKFIIT